MQHGWDEEELIKSNHSCGDCRSHLKALMKHFRSELKRDDVYIKLAVCAPRSGKAKKTDKRGRPSLKHAPPDTVGEKASWKPDPTPENWKRAVVAVYRDDSKSAKRRPFTADVKIVQKPTPVDDDDAIEDEASGDDAADLDDDPANTTKYTFTAPDGSKIAFEYEGRLTPPLEEPRSPSFPPSPRERSPSPPTHYTCRISFCKEKFDFPIDEANHYKSVHRTKTGRFKCPVCPFTIAQKHLYYHHYQTYHDEVVRHCCDECGELIKSDFGFRLHKKRFHSPYVPKYGCKHCGERFKSSSAIRAHKLEAHGIEPELFMCPTCGKGFPTRKYCRNHQRIHTNDYAHKCAYCSFMTRFSGNLSAHMRKYHPDIWLLKSKIDIHYCHLCSFRSKDRGVLGRHLIMHANAEAEEREVQEQQQLQGNAQLQQEEVVQQMEVEVAVANAEQIHQQAPQ